jgi:hypothetical protein
MSWQDRLKGNSLDWLLEPDVPGVRYLALRDLLDYPDDDSELRKMRSEAHRIGPIAGVLAEMEPEGYWVRPGPGYTAKYRSTVWAIILLAQLGASVNEDERIRKACAYLVDHALAPGGKFSVSGAPSYTIDCLQGNLCWALLELGYEDVRLDEAFEWMARGVTGEGVAAATEKNVPLRYYSYKCGPNFACGVNGSKSCAWGAVKVMMALGKLPADRRTPLVERAIQQGIDFLFSVEPSRAGWPTRTDSKPNRSWWKFGFPVFYITDLLQVVEALALHGLAGDRRLAKTVDLICDQQDANGRWSLEYDYMGKTWINFGEKHQPNKWVTLRALRALKAAYN